MRSNCLLKHVIEGNVEGRIAVTGTQGRRLKQLLKNLKEKRVYFEMKEGTLTHTSWRTGFGRGF
jgi:hypothetical protein